MANSNITKLLSDNRFVKDINFLNHIGYFCHDPKRAKEIKEPQTYKENTTINGERSEIIYTISPNVASGYPSVTAYNICDFIDRILTLHGRPALNPIPFDMVTLREFLGLTKTGHNNKTITTALNQLRSTIIKTTHFFLNRNRKWVSTDYTLIEKLVFVGENENDVNAGLIYLNKEILESFNNKNNMPVNYERYGDLPTPTKALYLKLFRAFSSAKKSGKNSNEITVENDYNALCKVLGFVPKKYKSRVEQQLEPHLSTLKDIKKLVRGWTIEKKKNKTGFKLASAPGEGFDEDYNKFNNTSEQIELPFVKRNKKVVEEIEAVRYFHEKMFGLNQASAQKISHVSNKELILAKKILQKFPGKKIYEFVDYATKEAKLTKFQIKTFNGLEGFINAFQGEDAKNLKGQKIKKLQEETKKKEQELATLHIEFIENTYSIYLNNLTAEERKKQDHFIHEKVLNNIVCKNYTENLNPSFKKTPVYKGIFLNEIRKFTAINLVVDFENEFKKWLKKHNKI